MSLWFSGADSVYQPSGGGVSFGHKAPSAKGYSMNSQSETVHKPHGKMACENASYCNPARTCLDVGALAERNCWTVTPGDKRGKRITDKPDAPALTPRRVAHGTAAPNKNPGAPFALGDTERDAMPYHQQKRHVDAPKSNQRVGTSGAGAEDMFILKRSRTPPATEKNRPKTEGFCILHGFDARVGKFTREMMQVVPAKQSVHGKASADWEKEVTVRRELKEDRRNIVLGERGRLARERDQNYHNIDEKRASRPNSMKGRAQTPPANHRAPYATGLPTPVAPPPCISIPKWRN